MNKYYIYMQHVCIEEKWNEKWSSLQKPTFCEMYIHRGYKPLHCHLRKAWWYHHDEKYICRNIPIFPVESNEKGGFHSERKPPEWPILAVTLRSLQLYNVCAAATGYICLLWCLNAALHFTWAYSLWPDRPKKVSRWNMCVLINHCLQLLEMQK